MKFFWALSLAPYTLALKLGRFVAGIGSINCLNSTFQLTAVRENEDFENWVFF